MNDFFSLYRCHNILKFVSVFSSVLFCTCLLFHPLLSCVVQFCILSDIIQTLYLSIILVTLPIHCQTFYSLYYINQYCNTFYPCILLPVSSYYAGNTIVFECIKFCNTFRRSMLKFHIYIYFITSKTHRSKIISIILYIYESIGTIQVYVRNKLKTFFRHISN